MVERYSQTIRVVQATIHSPVRAHTIDHRPVELRPIQGHLVTEVLHLLLAEVRVLLIHLQGVVHQAADGVLVVIHVQVVQVRTAQVVIRGRVVPAPAVPVAIHVQAVRVHEVREAHEVQVVPQDQVVHLVLQARDDNQRIITNQ